MAHTTIILGSYLERLPLHIRCTISSQGSISNTQKEDDTRLSLERLPLHIRFTISSQGSIGNTQKEDDTRLSLEERHRHFAEMKPMVARVHEVRRVDAIERHECVRNSTDEGVHTQQRLVGSVRLKQQICIKLLG